MKRETDKIKAKKQGLDVGFTGERGGRQIDRQAEGRDINER